MDQHVASSGAGEQKAFRGVHNRVISPAGLLFVSPSLCPHFGASAL